MAMEFAGKYAAEFEPDSQIRLSIKATGINRRQFLASSPTVTSWDIDDADGSKAKSFPFTDTVTAGTLQANWREIAIDCAYQFVQLFPGGMAMSRELVGKWVAKYLGEAVHW